MKTTIEVENIKCGGCANSIRKELGTIQGVFTVEVDIVNGTIVAEHTDEVDREQIAAKLLKMGYYETGTVNGFDAIKADAKSFVSCVIGRVSK